MSDLAPASRLVNKLQVSEFFNVSFKTVDLWVRRGCPFVERGGTSSPWVFDLLAVAEWRYTPKRASFDDPDALKPKDRRDWYEGEKVRIRVEDLQENLITRAEFDAEKERIQSVLAECLERLPGRLEVACGLPPAVAEALRRECAAMIWNPRLSPTPPGPSGRLR